MVFEKPVRREASGLDGAGWVRLAVKVVPVGWISATGVMQDVHRRLPQLMHLGIPSLPSDREIRRDWPVPSEVWSSTTELSIEVPKLRPIRGRFSRVDPDNPQRANRHRGKISLWSGVPGAVRRLTITSTGFVSHRGRTKGGTLPWCHCREGQLSHADALNVRDECEGA